MTPSIHDPAQWLVRLFCCKTAVPAQWQELSTNLAALRPDYARKISALWPAGAQSGAQAPQDKRFAGDTWRADPRFEMATRSYQAYASLLHGAIASSPAGREDKEEPMGIRRAAPGRCAKAREFRGDQPGGHAARGGVRWKEPR